jgi:hypothetical protein
MVIVDESKISEHTPAFHVALEISYLTITRASEYNNATGFPIYEI